MLFQLSFIAIGRNVFAFVADEQFSLITKINQSAEKTWAVQLECVQKGLMLVSFWRKSNLSWFRTMTKILIWHQRNLNFLSFNKVKNIYCIIIYLEAVYYSS